MATTAKDLLARARQRIREIAPEEARQELDAGAIALDVRETEEVADGQIPGAIHVPRGFLEFKAPQHDALADPNRAVVVYCKGGSRAALAAETLQELGYANVSSIAGGFEAWTQGGHPIALPEDADEEE